MQHFRHYDQSFGELCKLPGVLQDITYHAVGTSECRTCLCLYVKFTDESVFIAHMSASLIDEFPPQSSSSSSSSSSISKEAKREKNLANWTSSAEKGESLKQFVLKQLRSSAATGSKEDLSNKTPIEAFFVCPAIAYHGPTANGRYIRDAIQEFFHPFPVQAFKGHGFVAGPGISTVVMGWDDGALETEPQPSEREKGPNVYGWKEVGRVVVDDESFDDMEKGQWSFYYYMDRWGTHGEQVARFDEKEYGGR
ncbi:uncharacterized protein RCC_08962 [Ramularia collo-cygni]|uniref:Uncharacterized protein n=1 Tax=Ramularia collo-cygni TaxID=112498 RepID=A0A2D3VGG9_9PEZI|nr:uncharacterized protein RCC_08962 [Ramularia collo-cygni]CZT23251.1 uncharacterized protein RCC_08962 [Ramularia collo-cygni]